ncbi:DUF3305 domain-containing protein [Undibacterium sp. SXout7W]|uniref:DUF3305 domain-containing protein n=1 Tax=Undibacterium sp. SXout7W TaxID=3413049 RepID=UPI003BF2B24C
MKTHTELPFLASIIMQRLPINNPWQAYQWKLLEIIPDMPGTSVRCLMDGDGEQRWLFPGFSTQLFADEAPGYFLNISSPVPCWFVMWRIEDVNGADIAVPKSLSLSYNEAARLMDGGEQVETVPLSDDIARWLAEYTQEHFQPEEKRPRKRPSFEGGEAVDKMARAETDPLLRERKHGG